MKNFIVFFTEKEGSSALMHLLDNFDEVDIIHQINNQGWEPLDAHHAGDLSISRLAKLFSYIYGPDKISLGRLNRFYTKTAGLPLDTFSKDNSVGLKMRLDPHEYVYKIAQTRFDAWNRYWEERLQEPYPERFKATIYDALQNHNVVVFLTVRQDVLRWALSKYHGDGTGKPGHIQFRLATGELKKHEIEKVTVDLDRLGRIIEQCEAVHARYKALSDDLKGRGIEVYPLKYEEFLEDKQSYFMKLGKYLGIDWDMGKVDQAMSAGSYLKKVHSNNIESFVTNHQEVMERFGDRYVAWS